MKPPQQPGAFIPAEWVETCRVGNWRNYNPATLELAGELVTFPNGVAQQFREADLQAMIDQWRFAGRPELLIDQDHFSNDPRQPTDALGWIVEMEYRTTPAPSLWVKPRWSTLGLEKVGGGVLRFQSIVVGGEMPPEEKTRLENGLTAALQKLPADAPEADRAAAVEAWARRTVPKLHPVEFRELALTNKPAMRGLTPVCNRAAEPDKSPAGTSGTLTNNNTKPTAKTMDPEILKKLGLEEGATLEQVLAKLDELTAAAAQVAQLQNTAAERFLDDNKAVIKNEARDAWKQRYLADPAGTVALLNGVAPTAAAAGTTTTTTGNAPVFNRGVSAPPAASAAAAGDKALTKESTDEEIYGVYNKMPVGRERSAFFRKHEAALTRVLNRPAHQRPA